MRRKGLVHIIFSFENPFARLVDANLRMEEGAASLSSELRLELIRGMPCSLSFRATPDADDDMRGSSKGLSSSIDCPGQTLGRKEKGFRLAIVDPSAKHRSCECEKKVGCLSL